MFVFIKYSKTHIECRKLKYEVLYLINEPLLEAEFILIFHNNSHIYLYDIYELRLISFFDIGLVILIIVVLSIQILI